MNFMNAQLMRYAGATGWRDSFTVYSLEIIIVLIYFFFPNNLVINYSFYCQLGQIYFVCFFVYTIIYHTDYIFIDKKKSFINVELILIFHSNIIIKKKNIAINLIHTTIY